MEVINDVIVNIINLFHILCYLYYVHGLLYDDGPCR